MKRISSFVVVLLIFLSCSVKSFAAEYEDTGTADVYGVYIAYANEGIHTAVPENGAYEVTTGDGIQITVGGAQAECSLIIHQISGEETECYDWMESCLPEVVVNFVPFHIYFLGASGEKTKLPSGVEIAMSTGGTNVSVLQLSYDGEVTVIPHSVSDGRLMFETVENGGYYLLCETAGEIETPDTGDSAGLQLWIIVLMISLMMVMVTVEKHRTMSRQH